MQGPLAPVPSPVRLDPEEVCYLIRETVWNEMRKRRRSGQSLDQLTPIHQGQLLITNKRFLLYGAMQSADMLQKHPTQPLLKLAEPGESVPTLRVDRAATSGQIDDAAEAVVLGLKYPVPIVKGLSAYHWDDRDDVRKSGSQRRCHRVVIYSEVY